MASHVRKQPPKYAETNSENIPKVTESSILVEPTAPQVSLGPQQQPSQTGITFKNARKIILLSVFVIVCLTLLGLLLAYMIYQPDMICEEGTELVRSRWLSFHFKCAPVEEVSWLTNLLRTIGVWAIGFGVVVVLCGCCCFAAGG